MKLRPVLRRALVLLFPFCGALLQSHTRAAVWSHYSFDADFTDISGNAQHGTLTDVGTLGNSGITTAAGDWKFGGGAMNFSVERDYLAIPSKTFASGSPYSIAFWAKKAPGDTGDAASFDMVIGDQTSTNFFIALGNAVGTPAAPGLRWRSAGTTADRQQDYPCPDDTNWHHYAIVASGTNLSFYLDGAFVSTATGKLTGIILNAIGEAYPASRDFDFNGQIDEMWVFDSAIDAAAVASLYTSNTPTPPVANQGFHHRYDGDYSDANGNGNAGLPLGAATITSDPAAIAHGTGALSLDGADATFVNLTATQTFAASDPWSATWWARRGELGASKGMIMGSAATTTDFIWLNDAFTGLRFRSSNNITFDFTVPQDMLLHHYALVASGAGTLELYRDGALLQSLAGNTSFMVDAVGKAYPTTGSTRYNFQGSLDEVHLFPSALNATQVGQLYDAEKPGTPPSAVTRLRVVLLGGQSNADGRAPTSGLPTSPLNLQLPQADVDLFYKYEGAVAALTTLRPGLTETGQFGPDILLGRSLADQFRQEAGTRIAIIRYANGGTDLKSQWKAGGDATTTGDGPEYVIFQQTVTAGLAALANAYPGATLDLQGMCWLQGESDAVAGASNLYEANLAAFIADVRATYGSTLPFVIARLSSQQTALEAVHLNAVRAAEDAVAAADPLTTIFPTDTLAINADNLHFSASAQQVIGRSLAGEISYLDWVRVNFTPGDITAGLAEAGADRDGDGTTNQQEFASGTSPVSTASTFTTQLTATATPGTWSVSYASSTARIYAVDHYREDTHVWEETLPGIRGTGAVVVRQINASADHGIYRVRATLP